MRLTKGMRLTASQYLQSVWVNLAERFGAMSAAGLAFNLVLTAVLVGAGIGVMVLARSALRYGARHIPGDPSAEKMVRISRVSRLLAGALRVIVATIVLVWIAQVWGFDPIGWTRHGFGERAAAAAIHILILAIAAIIAFEAAGLIIVRLLDRIAAEALEDRRRAQLRTLGPLLQGLVKTIIIIVTVLMALSELDVKIGPLLAGAGVVGLALGFGAQTLVKDFLTGLFLIAEDVVSVGDIVRIGESGGLVEQMTLRSIRLRDLRWDVAHLPVQRGAGCPQSYEELLLLRLRPAGFL